MITGTNNPFACDPVIFTATNSIVALGTITRVGNSFTFSVGFVWKINGTIYQNAAPITITVAEADAGYNRIDNAILNTSNSIELQQGLPSNAVALQPVEPENAILLTSWDISGASVSEEVPPILGNTFLQKEFEKSQVVYALGSGVTIPLNIKGRNNIILNGPMTGVVGFSLINLDANPANAEYPHEGKDYYIQNKTGHDVTLKNADVTVDICFISKDENDIVVPNNGIIFFKNSSNKLQEIFRNYDSFDITQKADLVGGKVPASQLPSYVDDVIEVASFSSLPTTGEEGKIYVTLDTNLQYRWGGTGYVEISDRTAVWGLISGPITNQTDLMNLLNAKQDLLISGTNIKTINGEDVLGSGNIVISGGSSVSGQHIMFKPIPGAYYSNDKTSVSGGIAGFSAGLILLQPFMPANNLSVDTGYVNITTASTSGNTLKFAIYSDLDGKPNSKLFESANVDNTTTGVKSFSVSFTFNAGTVYWLAFLPTASCSVTGIPTADNIILGVGNPVSSLTTKYTAYRVVSSTYPATLTLSESNLSTSVVPRVFFKAV